MDYCEGGDLFKTINSQKGVQFPEEQVKHKRQVKMPPQTDFCHGWMDGCHEHAFDSVCILIDPGLVGADMPRLEARTRP